MDWKLRETILDVLSSNRIMTVATNRSDGWPQATITIELRKLHPPCPGNPDYTAVRLSDG